MNKHVGLHTSPNAIMDKGNPKTQVSCVLSFWEAMRIFILSDDAQMFTSKVITHKLSNPIKVQPKAMMIKRYSNAHVLNTTNDHLTSVRALLFQLKLPKPQKRQIPVPIVDITNSTNKRSTPFESL
eukprot:4497058-Amphidinium_carterae.1